MTPHPVDLSLDQVHKYCLLESSTRFSGLGVFPPPSEAVFLGIYACHVYSFGLLLSRLHHLLALSLVIRLVTYCRRSLNSLHLRA